MDRRTALRRVGLVVLGVNAALVLAKGAVWYATGSLAVGSEAVNSLADTAYSLAVVAGLYLTTRPPDEDHPHGHERIEPFVSLLIALGIFGAGALVLRTAIGSLLGGAPAPPSGVLPVAVLAAGGIAKGWLYRYCLRAGREHNSPALVAAAHDTRADVLTAGAALVGVLGAGAGYPALDPLAAAVVAVGILHAAVGIVRDNVSYLVGGAPSEELRAEIVRRALAHPEVEGAHDVVAHYVGPEVDVSLHLEVEGEITLLEAHEVETSVAESIRGIEEVDDVFIHMDPRELGEWKAESGDERFVGPPGR
ncbi:MAG: cation diffusion facilitator family transporter [Haloferacaceae archaeon]